MTRPDEPNPEAGSIDTHLGYRLYWQRNEAGGRTYHSDEVPTGVFIWDTCLAAYGTLCEAISMEFALQAAERRADDRERLAHQSELQRQAGQLVAQIRATEGTVATPSFTFPASEGPSWPGAQGVNIEISSDTYAESFGPDKPIPAARLYSSRQLTALLAIARTQLQLMPDATSQRIADEISRLLGQ